MKVRKKPIVVDAEQFHVWVKPYPKGVYWFPLSGGQETFGGEQGEFRIDTLEGFHIVSNGDWIITGVKGERYPCKPDIFELTYDRIENVST
jgi:hypothetical protein